MPLDSKSYISIDDFFFFWVEFVQLLTFSKKPTNSRGNILLYKYGYWVSSPYFTIFALGYKKFSGVSNHFTVQYIFQIVKTKVFSSKSQVIVANQSYNNHYSLNLNTNIRLAIYAFYNIILTHKSEYRLNMSCLVPNLGMTALLACLARANPCLA